MIRRVAWPLAPITLLLPAGLVTAVAFGLTLENFGWRPEWPMTSALAHEHLSLVGPVAAGAAFYRWATLGRPTGLFAAARLEGTDKPEHWLTFLRVWAVCAVAYTVGLVPIFVHTAVSATYGGPDVGAILLGYLGLGFAVAIGQFTAAVAPAPVLTVFVPLLVFLLFQLAQIGVNSFGAVLPVQWTRVAANEYETTAALLFRAFATLAIGGAMVLAARLGRSPDRTARTVLPQVGAVAVLVVFLTAAAVNRPAPIAAVADPPRMCRQVSEIEVCVHPAHEADLPGMADTVAGLVDAYGRRPDAVAGVYDSAAVPTGGLPDDYVEVGLILDQTTRVSTGENVAMSMSGFFGCVRGVESGGDRAAFEAGMAHSAELARWLLDQAEIVVPSLGPYERPASGFFAGSPEQIRAWLAVNDQQVAECRFGTDLGQ